MKPRVMTYNIGHYDYGVGVGLPSNIYATKRTNYRDFFSEQAPDILGLQEWATYLDDNNTVQANPEIFDPYFNFNGGNTNLWCALKSNYYVYDLNIGTLRGTRPYVSAKAMTQYGPVLLLSVHFSAGYGSTYAAYRRSEALELIQLVNNVPRYIIFGDFNPDPGEEDALFALFTNAGMNMANCGAFGKFHTWHNDPNCVIDNILTSSNIAITQVEVLEVYDYLSSDHLPLVAELEVLG